MPTKTFPDKITETKKHRTQNVRCFYYMYYIYYFKLSSMYFLVTDLSLFKMSQGVPLNST